MKKIYVVWMSGFLLFMAFLFHLLDITTTKNITLILATFMAGWSTAKTAIQSILMKSFSIELLVTIAVIGALLIGEYVESAAVTFLFLFGAYLEVRSLEKTGASLKGLMDMAPLEATVWKDGNKVTIPVEEIKKGNHILIHSGEKVAVDGKIVSGEAFINEAAITGESVLAKKIQGDKVFSGTVMDHGYMEVLAEKVGDDTTFSKIIELVEEAQEKKARTQRFLENFANFYTPSIIVLSILVFLWTKNIELTLTFLVIACPGALVISAPVSLVAGIGNGARHGTLIKGGEVMEQIAKLDVIMFDKTGTLTEGKPSVTNIKTYNIEEAALLKMIAEAELASEHHLGQTIVQEAKKRDIRLTKQAKNVDVIKGHGLTAEIGINKIIIGNRRLLALKEIELPSSVEADILQQEIAGDTSVFVAVNQVVKGVIFIADKVRNDAEEVIQGLKRLGLKQTVMLTGDHTHTAKKVNNQLGMDAVFANLLPEDKIEYVKKLQDEGYRVAMVGDGINDAPAIAQADVGIAMGAVGTDAAMETADVVLMGDELSRLPYALALSKATVSNMKQNMYFAVGTVALLLAGVLLGKVFLASGMLLHELSVLAVIMNALRLVRFKNHKKVETAKEDVTHAELSSL